MENKQPLDLTELKQSINESQKRIEDGGAIVEERLAKIDEGFKLAAQNVGRMIDDDAMARILKGFREVSEKREKELIEWKKGSDPMNLMRFFPMFNTLHTFSYSLETLSLFLLYSSNALDAAAEYFYQLGEK